MRTNTLVLSRGIQKRMASSPADKDARLVAAAQRQRVKFVALYDKYFSRVYRYVAQRVGVQQDAEDLTSLVFIEAMESLDNYREQGSFAGWLFSISRRKVVDHYRRPDGEIPLEMANDDELASTTKTLESHVIHDERLHRLAQELQTLAPEKQEVLAQRFFAGLKYKEIASVLGKSEGAIKMTVYRTLDELRERMLAVEEGRDVSE
ncbi:MAG: sigma-70 family RNA polymerase sigma factor [Anaerolineae bacterium]|nr:sigma-70 family RNA polymerase sigma factor [Anaerolineae bacterium]